MSCLEPHVVETRYFEPLTSAACCSIKFTSSLSSTESLPQESLRLPKGSWSIYLLSSMMRPRRLPLLHTFSRTVSQWT